jgi:hypothetical protein
MLLWSVVGGTLPLGLSFEATPGGGCMVFGTPTTAGTYVFALELFNAATTVGVTRVFALEVRDSSGPLTIATQYLGECRLSDGIHVRLEAAGGSGSGHIWSVAPGAVLPSGVSLSVDVISGIPAQIGTYSFTLQVVDSAASVATRDYTIEAINAGGVREQVVLLLDASGSMAGSKVAALRAEAVSIINSLPPHYRLDAVAFGDQFGATSAYNAKHWGSVQPMTQANQGSVTNWVNGPSLNPGGGTPLYPALKDTIYTYRPSLKTLIVISDGYPNTGGSSNLILADMPGWWSAMDDCSFIGVCIGGGGASFMQQICALTGGTYIAA